ncbi:class I SAM-dependent methyltransferase [Spirillospora sp. NPDC052269]
MTASPGRPDHVDLAFRGTPPWDIGRPQPALLDLAGSGALTGRVLDVGCGTGEHTLMAAALGLDVTGVDMADAALRAAKAKARERALRARFLHCDVQALTDLGEVFDTVLDSLVFHALDDDVRTVYLAGLRAVLRPGGRLFLLGYSDRQPDHVRVPHGLTREQITDHFADGWRIDSFDEVLSIANPYPDGVAAWLVGLTRVPQSSS